MLVLSRLPNESIMVGDNVEVSIIEVRGDKVRIGITAPDEMPVHRREVWEQIQREKRAAAKANQNVLTRSAKAASYPIPKPRPQVISRKQAGCVLSWCGINGELCGECARVNK